MESTNEGGAVMSTKRLFLYAFAVLAILLTVHSSDLSSQSAHLSSQLPPPPGEAGGIVVGAWCLRNRLLVGLGDTFISPRTFPEKLGSSAGFGRYPTQQIRLCESAPSMVHLPLEVPGMFRLLSPGHS